ncbi:MAG: potassium channel family protein, partial [Betaproteobacteria bacterium]
MVLIDGNGALAAAIEQRLQELGSRVERVCLNCDTGGSLAAESLQRARVLVLAADDDSGNIDLALRVRRLSPGLPMVVRVFDAALAAYLSETISGVTLLSMSKVTAPVFAEAARRILFAGPTQRSPGVVPRRSSRRYRVDRILVGALISLLVLVFPSALVFAQALDLRYIDALYFVWTTVMTVGYGDIALKDAGDGVKLFGMLLMLAGASFIAVLFALLSDWVLSRRLEVLQGRIRVRGKGHVVVAGAGNVGLRIAEILAADALRLVIIELRSESRNVSALRSAGHHVIIADATHRETLELAGIESASLILAVTDSDAVNLQIALHAREHGVPVVMR